MVSAESQAAMDAAKRAVEEFMQRDGHNDTTVHETVQPAVYHETISRAEKEELITLLDREVTQDHYHTSVQPITDSETLDEQHHHNLLPVESRTIEHDDESDRDIRLAAEIAKFKNETQYADGEHTQTIIPMVAVEHVHHHVHEIIQPVVNKYIIEPHIIHTTVQVHERIHNSSKHHQLSILPAVTLADFKKQGGVLTGREERWDSFEGEPRSVGGNVGTPNTNSGWNAVMAAVTTERHDEAAPAPTPAPATTAPAAPTPTERRSSVAQVPRRASMRPADAPSTATAAIPTPAEKPLGRTPTAAMTTADYSRPAQNLQTAAQSPQATQAPSQPQSQASQAQPAQTQASSRFPNILGRSAGNPGVPGHMQPLRAPVTGGRSNAQSQSSGQGQGQGQDQGRRGS